MFFRSQYCPGGYDVSNPGPYFSCFYGNQNAPPVGVTTLSTTASAETACGAFVFVFGGALLGVTSV
jgi:hypothetical protein